MKTNSLSLSVSSLRAACALGLAALFPVVLTPPSFAAGPVKAPDTSAPAEARTPIGLDTTPGDTDSLYRITQPGSYFLTGNLTGVSGKCGIEIAASRVTIDLNGFTMQGVAGSLDGIHVSDLFQQLTVRNGAISGWSNGVYAAYEDGHFVDLTFSNNAAAGLWAGTGIITDCIASGNGMFGVRALTGSVLTRVVARSNHDGIWTVGDGLRLVDCTARENIAYGIVLAGDSNTIVGCSATDNGIDGFQAGGYTSFERCTAKNNVANGFVVASGGTLGHCTAFFNNLSGFKLSPGTVLTESTANSNTQDGVETSSHARVENCTATSNGRFGFLLGLGSQIRGCVARQNAVIGINAESNCHIESNLAVNNGLQAPANSFSGGIQVLGSGCRVDGNTCTLNKIGFLAGAGDVIFVRNCARGNTGGNYLFAAGAEYAAIITNPGAGFVSTNPWANFAF